MWPWFAVPPLRAIGLWAVLPVTQRATLLPDTWVYPCFARLAMGCSNAVHLIMNVNLTVVGRVFLASARLGDAACELAELESDGGRNTANSTSTKPRMTDYSKPTDSGITVVVSSVVAKLPAVIPLMILFSLVTKPNVHLIASLFLFTCSADPPEMVTYVTG